MTYKETYQLNKRIEDLTLLRQNVVNDEYRKIQYKARYRHLKKHNPDFVTKVTDLIFELGGLTTKTKNQRKLDEFKDRAYRLLSI